MLVNRGEFQFTVCFLHLCQLHSHKMHMQLTNFNQVQGLIPKHSKFQTVFHVRFKFSQFKFLIIERICLKTESAAVAAMMHCVVLMLHSARSHNKLLTMRFVVWNKYDVVFQTWPQIRLRQIFCRSRIFCQMWKNSQISARAGAKIRYSHS